MKVKFVLITLHFFFVCDLEFHREALMHALSIDN